MNLLTSREAAELLKVSTSFLYKVSRAGKIPAMKMGRTWRYSKDELEKWIIKESKTISE